MKSAELIEQAPLDKKGQFVTVKQKLAAGFSYEESLLYVRAETVELWNALNISDRNGSNLSVDGPPGTGKSTEVWAWVLWKAKKDMITVTWIHMTKRTINKVVINGEENLITTGYICNVSDVVNSEGSLLVVDGVTADQQVEVSRACFNYCMMDEKERRFVLVSSSSAGTALQEDEEGNIVNFTVSSWTLEQYQLACKNIKFFDNVKANLKCSGSGGGINNEEANSEELVLSKYYFAGGCARWMFEFDYSRWQRDFNEHLLKVNDYNQLFRSGGGEQTAIAVNHLRGVTLVKTEGSVEKAFFFISEHAVATLAEKCSDIKTFFIDSYKKASDTKNPAYFGWIFEFDFDYQLQNAEKKELEFYNSLPTEKKVVGTYIEFSSVTDLGTAIKSFEVGKVLWAKPQLWCQKAYDFLCFWKDDADAERINMVVVNATVAQTHSVLLYEVNSLASALGNEDIGTPISAIRFDFAIPIGMQFTGGDVCGQICAWDSMDGKKWPNAVSFNQYVDAKCINVVEVARTM